jgi:hypothetical protein
LGAPLWKIGICDATLYYNGRGTQQIDAGHFQCALGSLNN